VRRPGTIRPRPYGDDSYPDDFYPEDAQGYGFRQRYAEDYAEDYPEEEQRYSERAPKKASRKRSVDAWMKQESTILPGVKRQKIALWLCRLPALLPLIFTLRGWLSLNEKLVLTNTEADVLGTGGEYCFLLCVSITPLITLTGQRWFAPLRRWYGVMFAVIGITDSITASITGEFAGGPIGRVSGADFLLAGFLIILLAIPVMITSNTKLQKALGRYWGKVQKVTYLIWVMIIIHLGLLDGFRPFDGPQGDGDPVFHQRFYQILVISLPLVILRLPPVKRWVTEQRAAGQAWKVWVAFMPLFTLYLLAFAFVMNEEFFTGYKIITMTPPNN
jgi:DMSO/TMAO reductase YedYZ heme-binding membrane subunit